MLLSQNQLLKIEISQDQTCAKMAFNADEPMEKMAAEAILDSLRAMKLAVQEEQQPAIEAFAAQLAVGKVPAPVVVAQGVPSEDDKPGEVKVLITTPDAAENEEGEAVNHYERSKFLIVQAGEPILQVVHVIEGKDGIDVYGKRISHKRAQPQKIKPGPNTVWNENDRTITAAIAGLVTIGTDKVSVDSCLRVAENVDFSTGNIDFPGDVTVSKNIVDLFKVKSSGTVSVHGVVEAAEVEAANDVTVTGGIAAKEKGSVKAGRNIQTKFITNAFVEAGGNITSLNEVVNSRIVCGGLLTVEKGPLGGGTITAREGVHCQDLGSDGNVKTLVEVGHDEKLRRLCAEHAPEIKAKRTRADEVKGVVEPLMKNQKSLRADQKERATELLFQAMELESEADALAVELEKAYKSLQEVTAILQVDGNVFPGVTIRFPRFETKIHEALAGPIKFELRETEGQPKVIVAIDPASNSVVEMNTRRVRDETLNTLTVLFQEEE